MSDKPKLDSRLENLLQARSYEPYALLGMHETDGGCMVRVLQPHAAAVTLIDAQGEQKMTHADERGLFEWHGASRPGRYRLRVETPEGTQIGHDAYAFGPRMSTDDLYLFNEGRLLQAWRTLGANFTHLDGVPGVRFAVWAPSAERVSVVGDFNRWDGRVHPMQSQGASGVWMLFVPDIGPGTLYKFEIRNQATGEILVKSDPYARACELRPGTASKVAEDTDYEWQDTEWLGSRANWDWLYAPLNVYELHPGSWRRHPDGRPYTWRELADALIPYVSDMGYTHIELLPVSEHPLDESWGYQTTGYFAPTSRYGTPDDLRAFVDACHRAGVGVLLDWVPAHFPADAWALARFDGSALYEHEDPRKGFHRDWGTYIFNYGRNEVISFLISSAHYWLSEFHFDGLRVDAVASMLYLDYSRNEGEWLPNKYGGRENLEAIDFLRALNVMVHDEFPGALTLAEESTAWPMVSRPVYLGGLGFSMKWNMGWMHDTLEYFRHDPVHRRFHHDELTFGQLYAYTENFVLPFSHDEVVHGKGSLLGKMPGDAWQQFANLRLLLTYQATYPGKKLNFMGNEFGQGREWRVGGELDWGLLGIDWHAGVQRMVRDINRLYRTAPALHELDFEHEGFRWIDCHDADQSVLSYLRRDRRGKALIVVLNFTPVPRMHYRIGIPDAATWRECFNSDSEFYGGSNLGNGAGLYAEPLPWMGFAHSLALTLPPLAGVVLTQD
jgi:1,4-alpha-glucan branching enzyme